MLSNTKHQASSIKHPASSTQHQAPSIKHPASSTQHQASSIKHQASSIKHQASSIKHHPIAKSKVTINAFSFFLLPVSSFPDNSVQITRVSSLTPPFTNAVKHKA
ncbi:hypothetical protein QUF72_02330 [Desulfobacterales bacterium HSG2]|nr:hypothetical protein [Desulfobacterales bacterium HSG2]